MDIEGTATGIAKELEGFFSLFPHHAIGFDHDGEKAALLGLFSKECAIMVLFDTFTMLRSCAVHEGANYGAFVRGGFTDTDIKEPAKGWAFLMRRGDGGKFHPYVRTDLVSVLQQEGTLEVNGIWHSLVGKGGTEQ